MRNQFAALLMLFSAPAYAAPAAPIASETTSGGYAIGSPRAPLHLIEYMSFTCPHCAHFTDEGATPLTRDYVARGKVYYEVRNAVRDGADMTAAMLARCGGSRKFFGNMAALMAGQKDWEAKLTAADPKGMNGTDPLVMYKLIAEKSGMIGLMQKRGFTVAQLNICLSDKAAQSKIVAMTHDAWDVRHIKGTPGFFINNDMFDGTGDWPTVHASLDSVLAVLAPKKR